MLLGCGGPPVLGIGVCGDANAAEGEDDVSVFFFSEELTSIGETEALGDVDLAVEVVDKDGGLVAVTLPPELTASLFGDDEFIEPAFGGRVVRLDDPTGFAASGWSDEEDDFLRLVGPINSLR